MVNDKITMLKLKRMLQLLDPRLLQARPHQEPPLGHPLPSEEVTLNALIPQPGWEHLAIAIAFRNVVFVISVLFFS